MKKKMHGVVICLVCVYSSLLSADPVRPITKDLPKTAQLPSSYSESLCQLDRTISLTQKTWEEQKELRKMIHEYIVLHTNYKQNLEDRALSYQMVKQAHKVISKIKELHLSHAFDQELLSDLAFFSGIIDRWEGLESLSTIE